MAWAAKQMPAVQGKALFVSSVTIWCVDRSGTPLVKESSATGLRAVNGLGMLVAQGFEIWTGQKPPEGVMRLALDNIL